MQVFYSLSKPIQLVVVLWVFATAGALGCEGKPVPMLDITTDRDGDEVVAESREATTTLVVTSPRGIGSATIRRSGDQWPTTIVIRLHLRGLESLSIGNGKVKLAVSVLSHGDHDRLLHLWKGDREGPQLDTASPYWSDVTAVDAKGNSTTTIPLEEGFFQLAIPQALLDGNPESLRLEWIDFYR